MLILMINVYQTNFENLIAQRDLWCGGGCGSDVTCDQNHFELFD